jgi:MFS family permease
MYGRMQSNTEQGVKYYYYALLILLISVLLAFIVAIIAIASLYSVITGTPTESDISGIMGILLIIGIIACVMLIMLLISFIFVIIGLVKFNQGKNEFSPEHAKSVGLGTFFFILWIIFIALNFVVPFIFGPSIFADPDAALESQRNSAVIGSVLSLLGIIFSGLMLQYMVKEIAPESDKKLMMFGLILFIVAGVISLAITIVFLPSAVGDMTTEEVIQLSSGSGAIQSIGGIMQVIGLALFVLAYRNVLSGFQAGRIQPSYAPPPGYPPAPGYGYPPPQPPPPPPNY